METIKNSKTKVPVKSNYRAKPTVNVKDIASLIPGVSLDSFSVTHDSVVATMNFVITKDHRRIKIWWGDETQNQQPETIYFRGFQKPILGGEVLPKNTFKLQHGYDENAPKRKIILVQVQDKKGRVYWETAVIEIEARYTFISRDVIIEGNEDLDTFFETNSEFKIDMLATLNRGTLLDKRWELDIDTDDPPFSFRIKESAFKTQIIYSDEPIEINFFITEDDNIFKSIGNSILDFITNPGVEFDTSNQLNFFRFHPRDFKGSKQYKVNYSFDDDGSVEVIFNLEMNLIIPFDKVSQPVNAMV